MTFLACALCSSYTQKVVNCSERGITEGAEQTKLEQIVSGRNIKKRSESFVFWRRLKAMCIPWWDHVSCVQSDPPRVDSEEAAAEVWLPWSQWRRQEGTARFPWRDVNEHLRMFLRGRMPKLQFWIQTGVLPSNKRIFKYVWNIRKAWFYRQSAYLKLK